MFSFVPDASRAKGAAGAIFKLVDYQPNIERHAETQNACDEGAQAARTACIPEQPTQGRLVFDNVHFRYPSRPHVRVLQELNLTIEPGSFVALVGSSGCGKSTTIQMLERFYDPIAGTVSLDGHDIKQLDLEWYRSQIALVSQEPVSHIYPGRSR
jgi:ATP-binding cassette subfamily B (MDR/TAP) protein 1